MKRSLTIESLNFDPLPPAVLVHGLGEARLALGQARPTTLLSPPGAALSWGCLWWRALLSAAGYSGPALLDCATAPGRAAEALSIGLKGLVLSPCPSWNEIAELAAKNGATLLNARPPALDLRIHHAENRLISWLDG